jgi:transcriptional antiterminator NusG
MVTEEVELELEPVAEEDAVVPPADSSALEEGLAEEVMEDAPAPEEQATQVTEAMVEPAEAVTTSEARIVETVEAEAEVVAVQTEVEETTEQVDVLSEEAGEQEEAEILEPEDDRAWYVIHCYSGYESKVKYNLEQRIETMQMQDQIFQVVVPTEDEIEVRDGKRRVIERRVFPGYILVQMILNDDSWYVVRNTPGVTGFVGMGNEPTPLRTEEVQGIMRRMEAEAPKIKVTFKSGQKVRIIDGPFNEFIGVVDEIDMERAKVRVLVSFFGRETPVELDFLQVEKT